MQMNFSQEEVEQILTDHLRSQGFPVKHKKVEVRFKSRFLGKGQGQEHTLVVEIQDSPDQTPEEPTEKRPVTFAEDDS